jgi:hypothetical protein
MHILDSELCLITPTEPEGVESASPVALAPGELRITPTDPECGESASPVASAPGELGALTRPRSPDRYYQLTHDYLVHSLHDWLTRKQRETRRSRAELRLAERSSLWNAKPENRHLSSPLEWVNIRLLTRRRYRTELERRVMKRAGRFHGLLALGLITLVALGTWGGIEGYRALGENPKALDGLEFVIGKNPNAACAKQYQVIILARLGKKQDAWSELAKFQKEAATASFNLYLAAVVAAELGEATDKAFATLEREVTKEQWQRFLRTNPDLGLHPNFVHKYSPDPDGPTIGFTRYIAAQFSNWLSEQEGLSKDQWCCLPNNAGAYAEGVSIRQPSVPVASEKMALRFRLGGQQVARGDGPRRRKAGRKKL